jgi:hypothetical protein
VEVAPVAVVAALAIVGYVVAARRLGPHNPSLVLLSLFPGLLWQAVIVLIAVQALSTNPLVGAALLAFAVAMFAVYDRAAIRLYRAAHAVRTQEDVTRAWTEVHADLLVTMMGFTLLCAVIALVAILAWGLFLRGA